MSRQPKSVGTLTDAAWKPLIEVCAALSDKELLDAWQWEATTTNCWFVTYDLRDAINNVCRFELRERILAQILAPRSCDRGT